MSSAWCRIASELCCMCISRREMREPMSFLIWDASEGEPAWEADIVVVCACGAHGKVSCRQYLGFVSARTIKGRSSSLWYRPSHYGQPPGARLPLGFGKRVGVQSHSPPGLVHISPPRPHRPMDACTHSSTNVQVARARTRYSATLHTHAAHPRKSGRDDCPVAGRVFGHASDGAGSGIGRPPGIMPPT